MSSLYSAGEVVVRVVTGTAPPAPTLWLADALTDAGVRVAGHVRTPTTAHGCVVYALQHLHESGPVDWHEVGVMIRRVHDVAPADVAPHHPLPLAADFPWWQASDLLIEVSDLVDDAALAGLRSAIATHGDWRERADHVVVCHGDVHPGNVLQTADGAVLLDWDLLCLAPAAWDHAPLMTWTARWGGDRGIYERFADGYGSNLRGEPLGESLAVMRNVAATLMRLRAGRNDASAAAEAQRRLAYWRGEPDALQWRAM